MERKSAVLTQEELVVLTLAATHPGGKYLRNSEIAQCLGISVNRVTVRMRQACVKLKARNRNEAMFLAIKRGDIRLDELFPLEELLEVLGSLGPDLLIRVAHIVRHELEYGDVPAKYEQIIIRTESKRDAILTNRERDVLILAARGLTNREIADTLYMCISSVRTFLNRACTKLGARKRADAVMFAIKQREIGLGEICPLNEVVQFLAPLGADCIEKMAQLLKQELGREPIPTGS